MRRAPCFPSLGTIRTRNLSLSLSCADLTRLYSIVSLPKQLAVVYLGYEFGVNKETTDPANARKQRIISLSVFFGTAVATVLALYIVYMFVALPSFSLQTMS